MSYRQLLANLEALPEGERQLAYAHYVYRNADGVPICGCVLGKGIPSFRDLEGADNVEYVSFLVKERKRELLPDLSLDEARQAQHTNDYWMNAAGKLYDNSDAARSARYAYMIEWLRARVSEESQPAAGPP